ncbi:MAG: DUF6166 domain-containing protein [Alphaproteobacteria bacterium]|nr:DUF6166 domain-containing protein [Alphaproteobacteria bacterium]
MVEFPKISISGKIIAMQNERTYRGEVNPGGGIEVTVDGHPLDFFEDVLRESKEMPASFSWGTGTPGCVRLAFALLFDVSNDPEFAQRWSVAFCREKIDKLDRKTSWVMSSQCINDWVKKTRDSAMANKALKDQLKKIERGNSKSHRFYR